MKMKRIILPITMVLMIVAVSAWDAENITQLHVIFMNHLDVGYDGVPGTGFVDHILNIYFNEYFPRAVSVWEDLKAAGQENLFVYTTHPWLVSLYLNCPKLVLAGITLKCPDTAAVRRFQSAIHAGAISWHAGPMNLQMEYVADPWLLKFGIQLSKDLDQEFGIKRKTLVLSQRDVPGMTQAVIPVLARSGVSAVSVGVNDMTAPPAVPPVFSWHFLNESIIAMWHPGGYPRTPGPDPDHPGGLSIKDCVIVDKLSHAMCFAFRSDNQGPPLDTKEILGYYKILQKEFPHAKMRGSTFDAFVTQLLPFRKQLPVVKSEISDTWIQGAGTDPKKSAMYRAMSKLMEICFADGNCALKDPRVYEASRMLLKLPEHTWGLAYLQDTITWTNKQLEAQLSAPLFHNATLSWIEQRKFLKLSHNALQDHPIANEIADAWQGMEPKWPTDLSKADLVSPSQTFSCNGYDIAFNTEGAIRYLQRAEFQWASDSSLLSRFMYRTYNESDYAALGRVYDFNGTSAGYVKRNMTMNAHPESKWWNVALSELYKLKDSCIFRAHLKMVDREAVEKYGAPQHVWISYNLTQDKHVDIDFQWFGKSTTRLPEALMLLFEPVTKDIYEWGLSKLGQMIDPFNVVLNGSQYQHGIDQNGVIYQPTVKGYGQAMQITSADVPVVCPITEAVTKPTVFPAPLQPIRSRITGMAYNFYNNIWDTNFVYWYPYVKKDEDFKARFSVWI